MLHDDLRKKLENIVGGIILEGETDSCTAIRNLLCASFATSTTVKKDFESQSIVKEKQAHFLKTQSDLNNWRVQAPDEKDFLTKGGEASIYFDAGNSSVIKVNDAIYYATWLEFFNSLVIHNLLFKETAYSFLGFTEIAHVFYAVVRQPFIESDAHAEISEIKTLLAFNGFENTRRNDYINKDLGLILEDMHDENVIVKSETLFFIDTVFYTIAPGK